MVRANAVFAAGTPISAVTQSDNVVDVLTNADQYLVNPSGGLSGASNRLDLFPLSGTLTGAAIDGSPIDEFTDWDRDFNDLPRNATFRGAYSGEGNNPGWQLALETKPEGPTERVFADGFEQ